MRLLLGPTTGTTGKTASGQRDVVPTGPDESDEPVRRQSQLQPPIKRDLRLTGNRNSEVHQPGAGLARQHDYGKQRANWSKLIDGVTTGYTVHRVRLHVWTNAPNAPGSMTLDLKGLCTISSMRLLLWDLDNRYYRYKIEASSNNTTWITIVDRTDPTNECRSWQDISFNPPIQARYLRLTGTYNSSSQHRFHVVEWEVYGRHRAILTSANAVTVPEGSTATFQVKLNYAPPSPTTVTVSRVSGDTDITVQSGASLVFNASNLEHLPDGDAGGGVRFGPGQRFGGHSVQRARGGRQ